MAELTVRQARELLSDWAAVMRSRDERVRTAVGSGLSKSEVSRITGIARSTIHRIIESAPDGSATAHGEGAGP
jgi:transposase